MARMRGRMLLMRRRMREAADYGVKSAEPRQRQVAVAQVDPLT